ncbi:MAG: FtsX-like permease family protein [Clostridia bacterium]|jgi:putative ABC transport system permease protein|nr:FtsX-like permease family protein [Clostridia bacterium]
MKIETKLAFNNMKKNKKRTIFTTISIALCAVLIFVTMLLVCSIKSGITENIEKDYNDYHLIIRNLSVDDFNKIKDKEYIGKLYIEENNDEQLHELEKPYTSINVKNKFNIYIKFKNIKQLCKYSNDIIKILDISDNLKLSEDKLEFNQKLLTVYGLIDAEIVNQNHGPICRVRVNYSYVIDIIILLILVAFSVLFIIILYNAFLITISERKKEYAILNSIGGTEGQILKIIFLEGIIIGMIGISIGSLISILSTNIIIKILNGILSNIGYSFKLMFDIKYLLLSLFIILFNIYISSIIPSVKASTTSVIQGIKNNNQIKYKKNKIIVEKNIPIEGKLALRNIKRNKNKYRVITILLVVCMTSYIGVTTYINYEKVSAEIVSEYDVDAELHMDSSLNINYEKLLNGYKVKYEDDLEYMEYKKSGLFVLVEPSENLITNNLVKTYTNNEKSIQMLIIGMDNKTYNNYIKKLNANYGDFIIYNNVTEVNGNENLTYTYYPALKTKNNLKLSIIEIYDDYENNVSGYDVIDDKNINGKFVFTNELLEGYKELKTNYKTPIIFINMDDYNKIEENLNNYISPSNNRVKKWIFSDTDLISVKIKCKNIIQLSNYIEDINTKQNIELDIEYYTLQNQEKIIYINIIQLILRIIIISIIIIGIVSTINILNASFCEREQDFKILHSLGATKENINKMLIYECIYMFIKATIISIILSIPICYGIIKYMENIIILNKVLIPFINIIIFFAIIFLISIIVTLCSSKNIKGGQK